MATPTTHAPDEIGAAVRVLREERGWYRADLAKCAGISAWTIRDIETGRRLARRVTYAKIARALDVPLDRIFPGAHGPQQSKGTAA